MFISVYDYHHPVLLSNLFTSIFVSKTLFEFELSQRRVAEISI